MVERRDRVAGCLFGAAYGDALAAPAEFLGVDQILARWPPDGPDDLTRTPSLVTDDTQMMLAIGEALAEAMAGDPAAWAAPEALEAPLRRKLLEWLNDPQNNRAPGRTCLQACDQLERGLRWQAATVIASKGCGANMRVQPVGLLADIGPDPAALRAALAQYQAGWTHGHPTGLAAADLTARAISDLLAGGDPAGLVGRLQAYAAEQAAVYHEAWLGDLWRHAQGAGTPEEFIGRGWQECAAALDRLAAALQAPDRRTDPCLQTGAAWIAEEALATGLLCFLLYPGEPRRALQRAAVTSGDSDSIACLTGAFAGAHLGMAAWPAAWAERIEYADRLERLAAALA